MIRRMIRMKNVFARTVLALVLIPSIWMTSVGTAAAEGWVDTPGETVCNPAGIRGTRNGDGLGGVHKRLQVSFTVLGYFNAMLCPLDAGDSKYFT